MELYAPAHHFLMTTEWNEASDAHRKYVLEPEPGKAKSTWAIKIEGTDDKFCVSDMAFAFTKRDRSLKVRCNSGTTHMVLMVLI